MGVCSGRLNNRGLRNGIKKWVLSRFGHSPKKMRLSSKRGSLPRHIPVLDIYVSAPPHRVLHLILKQKNRLERCEIPSEVDQSDQ